MYYNINEFPFLKNFLHREEEIISEFKKSVAKETTIRDILAPETDNDVDYYTQWWAKDNGFHGDQIGFDIREDPEKYRVLTIWKKDFPIKHFNSELLFPSLINLMESVPNKHLCSIIQSMPGSVLNTHTHTRKQLVFHLLLNDLEGGSYDITVGNETRSMSKKGDWLIFDYSYPHSGKNMSKTLRYGLIIDFNPF